MTGDGNNERTPLLASNGANGSSHRVDDRDTVSIHSVHAIPPNSLPPASRDISPSRRWLILGFVFSISILLGIGGVLVETAQWEVIEGIICDNVHGPGPHPPSNDGKNPCKDEAVAGQVAQIMGWMQSIALLPGLFLSVAFGVIADTYGRRIAMGLAMLGITLSETVIMVICARPDVFPIHSLLFAPLFMAIGGGPFFFSSITYTIVADVTTEAQRSTYFFFVGAVVASGALLSKPIAYLARKQGVWFSIYLGLAILTISTICSFSIPETLDKKKAASTAPVSIHSREDDHGRSRFQRWVRKTKLSLYQTGLILRWLFWEQKLVGFLLLSLACEILGRQVDIITPIYISTRFKKSYAEAGLIQTVDFFTMLVLLTVILPFVSYFLLTHLKLSVREKDLRLAQVSALLAAIGTTVIGLAESLPLLLAAMVTKNLGVGYTYMLRGLTASLVGGHNIGLLYSSIAFVETVSGLIGGPLFGRLFGVGVGWGDDWIGLPYLVGGVILIGAAVLIGFIRTSFVQDGEVVEESGSGEGTDEEEG
ncbi:hypothetical protein OQA88_13125 [Cercophora sp. LCS_1]